jgi:hypothetical protein
VILNEITTEDTHQGKSRIPSLIKLWWCGGKQNFYFLTGCLSPSI